MRTPSRHSAGQQTRAYGRSGGASHRCAQSTRSLRRCLPLCSPYLVLSTGHILAVYSDPKKAGERPTALADCSMRRHARCAARRPPHVIPRPLLSHHPFLRPHPTTTTTTTHPPTHPGSTLALIDPATRSTSELATPFTSFSGPTLAVHEAPDGGALRVAAAAGSALQPAAVVLLEVDGVEALKGCGPGDWQVVRTSADIQARAVDALG